MQKNLVVPEGDLHLQGYGFESLMINEFAGREYQCSQFVPAGASYTGLSGTQQVCNAVSAVAGQTVISGTEYIRTAYAYESSHRWRNVGIIIGMTIFFLGTYMFFAEIVSARKSKGEVLVFKRKHVKRIQRMRQQGQDDIENGDIGSASIEKQEKPVEEKVPAHIQQQTAIFHWEDLCYDIKIKKEERRILDHVDGWVRRGSFFPSMQTDFGHAIGPARKADSSHGSQRSVASYKAFPQLI